MTEFLRDELRKAVRASNRKPLIICGAGVSTQATNGAAPSWAKLIHSGITRVADLDVNAGAWARQSQKGLKAGNTSEWIAVADEVTERLGGTHNAEFGTWLENEVGQLAPTRTDLLNAILALACPIATTNYDDILVKASGLTPIGWDDHVATHQFLEGRRQGILHLHGHWQSPKRVVLGSKSYGEHSEDERRKFLQGVASLSRPTLFIGCSQDGLSDPDFSRLDSFLNEWQDTAPRRYWLVRQETDDKGKPKQLPSPDHPRRLFPVPFGENYEDLVPLLHGLAPVPTATLVPVVDPDTTIRCIDQHEPRPEIFGREDEIEAIVGALLAGKPAIVAGGPGMGKTALATTALYDLRVVARFGRRRVFASLEGATEPHAILAKLVDALGLPPIGDEVSLLRILETNAADRAVAAILDNVETVFETNRDEAERLLKLVTQIEGLSLLVTIRGAPPLVTGSIVIEDLPKLAEKPARNAFLAVAGIAFESDPDLGHLLEALDGHALSIRLVAAQATGSPALKGLRESWDEAHAEILRRPGEKESRLTSVRASLALSLGGRRIQSTPLARRLLALLAYLPGGLGEDDVRLLLGERAVLTKVKANASVACLHQLRLVERRPDRRLRMLTPLRECVKGDVPIMAIDRNRLIDRYLAIAARAQKIGDMDWNQVREEVEAEIDNLDPVCELAVATNIANQHLEAALIGLGEFHMTSGRGGVESLERAATRFRSMPPSLRMANCVFALGRVAHQRSDEERAQARFEEALLLYRHVRAKNSEANCIHALGMVALARGAYEKALTSFEEAAVLHRSTPDKLGEANCIHGLGTIALQRSDHEVARTRFEEAQRLYQSIGAVSGEANCIFSLGTIALHLSAYETALAHHERALPLYLRTGQVLGQANSIRGIAQIAFRRSEYESARASIEQAIPLYRRIGDLVGEELCFYDLGRIASQLSDREKALAHFEEALALSRKGDIKLSEAETTIRYGQAKRSGGDSASGLADIEAGFAIYFRIADDKDRARSGWQALHRALTCANAAEAGKHREVARSVWTAIGRLDLIHEWIDHAS